MNPRKHVFHFLTTALLDDSILISGSYSNFYGWMRRVKFQCAYPVIALTCELSIETFPLLLRTG